MAIKVPVGVIGLGRLGSQHAINIATKILDAKLVAVADPIDTQLDKFGELFDSIKAYKDHRDLLEDASVKAVVIASPTRMHAKIAEEAILAGKYVYCEKPIALELEEAKYIKDLVEEKNAFFQIGFMRRFDPGYAAAKEKVMRGEIGDPVYFSSISRDPSAPPREFVKDSGGLFIDMCIHDIDIARWYMNAEIESVSAQAGVVMYDFLKEYDDFDQAMITLKFDNGSLGSIEGSRNSHYGYDVRTEIIGTKGAVQIGQWQHKPFLLLNSSGIIQETVPAFPERFKDAYLLELESFIDNILSEKAPAVNANDGYIAMKVATKAKEALAEGKTLTIE